jgi:hypothetical protein
VDSWKFDTRGRKGFTGDEKYSSDVAIQEIRSGIKSPQEACAERGDNWEDVQDQPSPTPSAYRRNAKPQA